jgi:hypothetical protein
MAAAQLAGGATKAGGAIAGGQAQVQAENAARQEALSGFNANTAINQPFIQSGNTALGELGTLTAPGGQLNSNFTMADFTQDPGYAFDLSQGNQAIQRSAAAQGTLESGGTLKDLTQYSQGMASNEFQNAYNRWQTTNQSRFSNLSTLAGMGQQAGVNQQANQNFETQNQTADIIGAGNARAGQITGAANDIGGAMQGVGAMYGYSNLPQPGVGVGAGGGGGTGYIPGTLASNFAAATSGMNQTAYNPNNPNGYGTGVQW